MKRRAVITAAVLVLAMLICQTAFADSLLIAPNPAAAGTLEIVKTVPSDGEEGKQPANMAVKIVFNESVADAANDAANAKLIVIKDPEGKTQAFQITHHPKTPNELWCVLEGDLVTNTEYTVTVSAGIRADSGNTLAKAMTFTFKTRNTKVDNSISFGLMLGMMFIMIFATMRAQNKQQEENTSKGKTAPAPEKVLQTDPYRLAKERGISVEEAKAIIAKEKEKVEKKNASGRKAREKYEADKAAREAEIERRLREIHDASVYKVKSRGSLAEHGGAIPKAVLKKQAARRKTRKK